MSGPYVEQTGEVGGAATALRDYLTWLGGYARMPGDTAFDRRLKMAQEAVGRILAEVAAAEERGAARVWSEYARSYGTAEKMPRWDQDKSVIRFGWQADRCGNCGAGLPGTAAAAADEDVRARERLARAIEERGFDG